MMPMIVDVRAVYRLEVIISTENALAAGVIFYRTSRACQHSVVFIKYQLI